MKSELSAAGIPICSARLIAATMQIKIEPVKKSEVPLLADISAQCFYETFHQQNSEEDMRLFLKENLTIHKLKDEMLEQGNYFFFAKAEDKTAGYIKLSASQIFDKDALEIARIYVVKDKIGFGVGKRLMEFAFSFAKQKNKKIIWLGVWEHNLHAIQFYRNFGFEKFSEHLFMLGSDAQTDWLMKKELSE